MFSTTLGLNFWNFTFRDVCCYLCFLFDCNCVLPRLANRVLQVRVSGGVQSGVGAETGAVVGVGVEAEVGVDAGAVVGVGVGVEAEVGVGGGASKRTPR